MYNAILEAQNIDLTGRYIRTDGYQNDTGLHDTQLIASNNVTINPERELEFEETSIYAGNLLTINGGDIDQYGIIFVPAKGTIEAGSLSSDFLVQNGDMNIISTDEDADEIRIGNLDHIYIGGNPLNISNLYLQSKYSIEFDGDITVSGDITAQAGYRVQVNSDAYLTAGNDINLLSDQYVRIYQDANLLAYNNVTIDPTRKLDMYGGTINASNQLTINTGNLLDYGVRFTPDSESIHADSLVSDFMTPGTLLDLYSNNQIYIGNLDHIYIGGAPIGFTGLNLESNNYVYLSGDVTVPGTVYISGRNSSTIVDNANINAGEDVILGSDNGNRYINSNATVHADRDVIFDGFGYGDSYIYSGANVSAGRNVELNSVNYSYIYQNARVTADGSILIQNNTTNNWGELTVREGAYLEAGQDIQFNNTSGYGFSRVYSDTQLIAGNDIIMLGYGVSLNDNSSLEANNVTLDPSGTLRVQNASIYANNILTLNGGDIQNNGLYFYPAAGTIEAGSLISDFLTPNAPLEILNAENALMIGNLDHIFIGGNPLGITDLNLSTLSSTLYLRGDITVPGNINLNTYNGEIYVYQNANIIAGNDINFNSSHDLRIYQDSFLRANNNMILDAGRFFDLRQSTLQVVNNLTMNVDLGLLNQVGIEFRPDSIQAGSLTSNFLAQNAPLNLNSTYFFDQWNGAAVSLSNLDDVIIGGAPLNPTNINISGYTDVYFYGGISTPGNIDVIGARNIRLFGDNRADNVWGYGDYLPTTSYVGSLVAENMYFDPSRQLHVDGVNLQVNNLLTLNSGDYENNGIVFRPYEINAGSLSSDFLNQNGSFNLSSENQPVYVGNLNNIFVGGAPLNPTEINLNATNNEVYLAGDVMTFGNINLTGSDVYIINTNFILPGDDVELANTIYGNNITADPSRYLYVNKTNITAMNQLTVNAANEGFGYGIFFVPDQVTAGSLNSDFLAQNAPLNIVYNDNDNPDASIGNLDHIMIGGSPLNPSEINILNFDLLGFYGDNSTPGDINLVGNTIKIDSISPDGLAGGGQQPGVQIIDQTPVDPEYTFDNTIISNINANNMTINPEYSLFLNNVDMNIANLLTVNGGDIDENGLYFVPNSIQAGSLDSDFLTQDGPLYINVTGEGGQQQNNGGFDPQEDGNNANVAIGNLDHIIIGGNTLNPSNIFINTGGYVYLVGDNSTPGELNLTGYSVNLIVNSLTTAGWQQGDVTINGTYVDIDGTLRAYGDNENRYLKVNSDGSIDPTSNINAIINAGNVEVADTIAGRGANVTINGEVTGYGEIEVFEGTRSIQIINDSTYNLLLNSLAVNTALSSTIDINGTDVRSDYGNISVLFDNNFTGNIEVDNNSNSDILLANNIINSIGLVDIANTGGSIFNYTAIPTITAIDLNLAAGGAIGANGDVINIDLVACTLNANANDDIFITELDGDLYVETIESAGGTVGLVANNGSILNVGIDGFNIIANDVLLDGNIIDLNVDINDTLSINGETVYIWGSVGGGISANVADIILTNVTDTYVNSIIATNTAEIISEIGSIYNNMPGGTNISAQQIALSALQGQIGTAEEALITDLTASELSAIALGDIYITEIDGDMGVNEIYSYGGDVNLTTENGSILDVSTTEDPNIIAYNVLLEANNGSIGTDTDDLNIDLVACTLNANANDDIFITELDGDLYVETIESAGGTVGLVANNGSILNVGIDGFNIIANDVLLDGNIIDLNVDINDTLSINGETVYIWGSVGGGISANVADIILTNVTDTYVNSIIATNTAEIISEIGSIYNNMPGGTNISAQQIALSALQGQIGTAEEALITDLTASELSAIALGDIYITEIDGDMGVNEIYSYGGDVNLTTENGSILDVSTTEDPNIIAYNVLLEANNGSIGTDTDDLNINLLSSQLDAYADGDIYVTEEDGDVDVGVVESAGGTVKLVANNGSLYGVDSEEYNVIADNAILYADEIALAFDVFNTTEINGLYADITGNTGVLDVITEFGINAENIFADNAYLYTNGDIAFAGTVGGYFNASGANVDVLGNIGGIINIISEELLLANFGNAYLGTIEAAGNAQIMSITGNILNGNGSSPNVIAQNIQFVAPEGQIGEVDNFLTIDLLASQLDAVAIGDIFISEILGDMELGTIESIEGNVTLRTENGSIVSVLEDDSIPNIVAHNIDLQANNGSIGSAIDDVLIDITECSLNAYADQDIYVTEFDGDLGLSIIDAGNGTVNLKTLNGSILDDMAGEEANIIAQNIQLTATNGSIGTAQDDINVDLTASTLGATATNSIYITENSGNVKVNKLQSTLGDVILKLLNGSVSSNIGTNENIIANNTKVSAKDISLNFNIKKDTTLNSTGNVNITGKTGNLTSANTGNFTYTNIDANNLNINSGGNLTLQQGNIKGTSNLTSGRNINVNASLDGMVNASGNNIYVFDTQGNLIVGMMRAPNGNITLTDNRGSILSGNSSVTNLVANSIDLTALFDIGSASQYLKAEVSGLLIARYGNNVYLIVNGEVYGDINPPEPTPEPIIPDSEFIDEIGKDINQINNSVLNVNPVSTTDPNYDPDYYVVLADPSMYLDDAYINVVTMILNKAVKVYQKALSENMSEEQALQMAAAVLQDANINPEIAKKLLKRKLIEMNMEYVKILRQLSNNQ
ncbi:MAG: hypothetical protein AB1782_15175 [Cyanobacteriota bacterium]